MEPEKRQITEIIERALAEDVGSGDVTTDTIIPAESILSGRFVAKEAGIVAGLAVARQTFLMLDEHVEFATLIEEGEGVATGETIATVRGPGRVLLTGERVALNFLQRMSGIATATHRLVEAVQKSGAIILDTRKTVPGLRLLDKWAVRLGGGQNHRFGLYDMALIKENHIAAAGGLAEAVARVRAGDEGQRPIEVEVRTLEELATALETDVDRIMLDNMSLTEMCEAVEMTAGRIPLEASGNVSLKTVGAIAATGVDYISSGALTHSVTALDISFLIEESTQ